MNESTTRNLTRFKYAAGMLGAMAVFALAPATANALPPVGNGAGGGCVYTDKDGYDIPLDDGQSVLVDGKTVTCSGGVVTTTKRNVGGVQPVGPTLGVSPAAPQRPPLAVNSNPIFAQAG